MLINEYLEQCKTWVDNALDKKLPPEQAVPTHLHQAMRYSLFNGGKRLRSAFIYAIGEQLAADKQVLNDLAMAIEMIHAYSLIHDDLPALDNDDLRRGKPTSHIAFGEATAILTGDSLQSLAFETIADIHLISPILVVEMIKVLSKAIGSCGMIGGEELDIAMVNQTVHVPDIEEMYRLKTGCLLGASVILAAIAANCQNQDTLFHLKHFGESIGIAFQIHDDIIGIESDTATLGKKQGADLAMNKPVYPILVGLEHAKKRRDQLISLALEHLKQTDCYSEKLYALSHFIISRTY